MPKERRVLETFKTKEEAVAAYGPDIEWYDDTNPDKRYRYGPNCFYCGAKTTGYIIEELSDGHLIGKPVCSRHLR